MGAIMLSRALEGWMILEILELRKPRYCSFDTVTLMIEQLISTYGDCAEISRSDEGIDVAFVCPKCLAATKAAM
jgi:hypothetical protein